jgi:hypothetical protein
MATYRVKATVEGTNSLFERNVKERTARAAVERMWSFLRSEGWTPRWVESEATNNPHDYARKGLR